MTITKPVCVCSTPGTRTAVFQKLHQLATGAEAARRTSSGLLDNFLATWRINSELNARTRVTSAVMQYHNERAERLAKRAEMVARIHKGLCA